MHAMWEIIFIYCKCLFACRSISPKIFLIFSDIRTLISNKDIKWKSRERDLIVWKNMNNIELEWL